MNKTIEIPDIAQWEETDSELAKYNIQQLTNKIKEYEDRFKVIKKIVEDNIFEDINGLEYCLMLSTISSVCDGKTGFLDLIEGEDGEDK